VRGDQSPTKPPAGRPRDVLLCRDVHVRYGEVAALTGVSLRVGHGEVVALLGASGSGKSTLLNVVAGLVQPASGEIWIDGRQVAGPAHSTAPEQRTVGMVFQSFALWPHLSVLDTVAYPLRRAGAAAGAARATAAGLLDQLGIAHLAGRRPAEISGGEQQRVGLARALARRARLYLLDEPTAHLDTHLRAAFQESVLARQRDTGAAVLYATHDAAEALALADRVALMESGRLLQLASPAVVYDEPVSLAAAALTGPCSVLTAGHVEPAGVGELSVDLGDGPVTVRGGHATPADERTGLQAAPGVLMVRPDWVELGGPFDGRVVSVAFRGPHTDYRLDHPAGSLLAALPGTPRLAVGDRLRWGLSRAWLLGRGESAAGAQPSAVIAPG
jgi:ABC-type Fe3+/spermidine/putrescine transport system ATPase subunit